MAGSQRHLSCRHEHEMPKPEDGEIQQPISPSTSNQPQSTAAQLLLSPTTMQQIESLPNANHEEPQYYSNDKEKYK